jgi:signal transduction histidine kinase
VEVLLEKNAIQTLRCSGQLRGDYAVLERILSNVLENSYDAIADKGRIRVDATSIRDFIGLIIEDSGRGMDADTLLCAGQTGLSVGKHDGNGLGLAHARSSLESWGGSLLISSRPREGTRIELRLPVC